MFGFLWPPTPPPLTFSTLWKLTKSQHFWTTYPPPLVNVVCERPLSRAGTLIVRSRGRCGRFAYSEFQLQLSRPVGYEVFDSWVQNLTFLPKKTLTLCGFFSSYIDSICPFRLPFRVKAAPQSLNYIWMGFFMNWLHMVYSRKTLITIVTLLREASFLYELIQFVYSDFYFE